MLRRLPPQSHTHRLLHNREFSLLTPILSHCCKAGSYLPGLHREFSLLTPILSHCCKGGSYLPGLQHHQKRWCGPSPTFYETFEPSELIVVKLAATCHVYTESSRC